MPGIGQFLFIGSVTAPTFGYEAADRSSLPIVNKKRNVSGFCRRCPFALQHAHVRAQRKIPATGIGQKCEKSLLRSCLPSVKMLGILEVVVQEGARRGEPRRQK